MNAIVEPRLARLAIQVEGLGKCYEIRHEQARFNTLRDQLAAGMRRASARQGDIDKEDFWALRDVGFELREGERLGIIGRNGAGKSTLLKLLSRITEPSTGQIRLHGRVASLLEVGTGFHPELTGRENIFLNGAILGMSRLDIASRFDEIVAFAEVERFLDTPVKRYSSGMYTRLAFSVAAHLDADILIVDEVLAVGDAVFQRKCLSKMEDATEHGRTVIFVSHNLQAVRRLCDRVLVLADGRVLADTDVQTGIQIYLDQSAGKQDEVGLAEQIAALPADPAVRMRSVRVAQDGRQTTEPETARAVEIQVDLAVLERVTGLRVYFDLCDADGTVLVRSFHDEFSDTCSVFEPGQYRFSGHIPAGLMGPVNYRLVVRASIFNVRSCTGDGVWLTLSPVHTSAHNAGYPNDVFRAKLVVDGQWRVESRG